MHNIDLTTNEFEFENEFELEGEGEFEFEGEMEGEALEMGLTTELLEVNNEQELCILKIRWFPIIFSTAKRRSGTSPRSP